KQLFVEFEFNSIGRRMFGEDFKVGRGFAAPAPAAKPAKTSKAAPENQTPELLLFGAAASEGSQETAPPEPAPPHAKSPAPAPVATNLKTIKDVLHEYHLLTEPKQRKELIKKLRGLKSFCFDTETTGLDVKTARLVGIAFSFEPRTGYYVAI